MLCLAFHGPTIRQHLDENEFHITTLFTEDDWKNFKVPKTEKTRVLFVNNVKSVRDYVKLSDENKKRMKRFKIVAFDIPHNFFTYRYLIHDANNRTDGIWQFQPVNHLNFASMIRETGSGLQAKKF